MPHVTYGPYRSETEARAAVARLVRDGLHAGLAIREATLPARKPSDPPEAFEGGRCWFVRGRKSDW